MNRDEATETLREVERLEGLTAARMKAFWQPFLVWGVLALGSVPIAALIGPQAAETCTRTVSEGVVCVGTLVDRPDTGMLVYWAFALPLGIAASVLLYRRRQLRPQFPYAWVIVGAALLLLTPLGIFSLSQGLITGERFVTMFTVVALANVVFGIVTRARTFAWISGLLLLLTGFSVFVTSHRAIVLSSGFAGVYLVGGWITKTKEAR
jgi:hypothetical protein